MRKILQTKVIILTMVLACTIHTGQVWATSNILFILDVSGRMAGKFPEHTKLTDPTKMQITTDLFDSLLLDLPKGFNVGLEVYGHRGDRDCTAIEMINPLSPLNEPAIMDNVRKLIPERGAIPLSEALVQGFEALKDLEGNKTIVLFSDGTDSCGNNLNEVTKRLEGQGIIINVLGIDVKKDESTQLSAIAEAGNGLYFAVNTIEDLENSITTIKEKLIDRKLDKKIFFHDDFSGGSLSEQWMILNPDKKSMSVKDGTVALFVNVSKPKKAANILHLDVPDPKDDWIFTANFNLVPQSMAEVFELGITNENGSQQILAQIQFNVVDNKVSNVFLRGIKDTRQSTSHFYKKLISFRSKNLKKHADFFKEHINSINIKLQKSGTAYIVSAKLEPIKEKDSAVSSDWVTLQKLISLPLPDDTFFIRTYLKDAKNYLSTNPTGKVDLNWVDIQTMKHGEN